MRTREGGRAPPSNVHAVNLWFDYRKVWAAHPLLLAYFVIVVVVLALAIYGTATRTGVLAILFIPALAAGYYHHMMVMKRLDS